MTEETAEVADPEPLTHEPEPDAEPESDAEPEPDAEPDAEPEPEPEPPELHGPSDAVLDKRRTDAERRAKNYTRALEGIYAEEWDDFIRCPLCPDTSPGFVYKGDVGRYPHEVEAAALFVIRGIEQVEHRASKRHHRCEDCDGRGQVATGSLVPGNETATCGDCRGYGYTPPPGEHVNGAGPPADVHFPAGDRDEPLATGDTDEWGEPRTLPDGRVNPNHGKLPHHKILVPPYGVTANLGATAGAT